MFNPSQNLLGKFRCLSQKSDCFCSLSFRLSPSRSPRTSFLFVLSSLYRFQGSPLSLLSR